ncbi:MAG: hypothetical protein V5B40_13505 [Candidatus Accumulibacter meliphilus]|jgi:hypothetical protein
MILFFFMLLMLAMAWGVVDHFQSIVSNAPPPKQAPVTLADLPESPANVV